MSDIDKALKVWFDTMMAKKGACISGPILHNKALDLYKAAAESKGEELDPDFKPI